MSVDFDLASLSRDFRAQRYFASLDGLRTISIIPVVWHHSCAREYSGLLGRGPIGVDLFFAISGFLITTLLLREREQHGQIKLLAFFARRSFRIFPLYYLLFLLHWGFAAYVRADWGPSRNFLALVPYYATYTANWVRATEPVGPTLFVFAWSLCTEEQFYAFWAPILRFSQKIGIAAVVMAAWLILDLLLEFGWLGAGGFAGSLALTIFESFATPIGVGALLAMAAHHGTLGKWLLWGFARRASAPLLALVVLSLVVVPWAKTPVLHLGLGLLVLSCSMRRDHGLNHWLDAVPLRYVGRISYGIYLWHVPVIGAIRSIAPGLRPQAGLVFMLALPLSVAVAALSYRYFEEPIIRRGAQFRRA